MGKYGSPICRFVDYKCYVWLDAEVQEESNDTKIVFIALGIRKLLTRSVRPTQRKQTIVIIIFVLDDEVNMYASKLKAGK